MIKVARNINRGEVVDTSAYTFANTEPIRRLHKSLNAYNVTPLVELKTFADEKLSSATEVFDGD